MRRNGCCDTHEQSIFTASKRSIERVTSIHIVFVGHLQAYETREIEQKGRLLDTYIHISKQILYYVGVFGFAFLALLHCWSSLISFFFWLM